MSNFRKVSDTNNLPNFIEKRFVGSQVEIEDDPYANLKKNSAENRIKISKQQIGMTRTSQSEKSWEKISPASTYDQLSDYTLENRINNGTYESSNENSDNVRTASNLQAFSAADYMSAMLSGNNELLPQLFGIESDFLQSQESQTVQAIENNAHRREAKAARHSTWEQNALDSLRKSQVVNSRAHSILRVASDNVSRSSQFGILDPNELDAREQSRVDSQEKARQQKLAIKKHMHDDLVAKSLNGSKTLADIYNSFDLED
jgi:hypothetical protein